MYFDYERFNKWEEETHIPAEIMDMVNWIAEKIGYPVCEETISLRNRFGDPIGYAKGFVISHCTSSYETGPTTDYTPTFVKWLSGLGFEVGASYGDNGMDSATNWHDTYWHKELIFSHSKTYEDFWVHESDDEEEEENEREYYGRDWYDDY